MFHQSSISVAPGSGDEEALALLMKEMFMGPVDDVIPSNPIFRVFAIALKPQLQKAFVEGVREGPNTSFVGRRLAAVSVHNITI